MLNLFLCGFGLKGASSKGDRITGSSLIYAECFFFCINTYVCVYVFVLLTHLQKINLFQLMFILFSSFPSIVKQQEWPAAGG